MDRREFLTRAGLGTIASASLLGALAEPAEAAAAHVRWDIISLSPPFIYPGGIASALAADGSKITLTGAGTFVAPASGGPSNAVKGGGTWKTFNPDGDLTGSGAYVVTGLVQWERAPGALPTPPIDNIDDPAERGAGLAVLRIQYLDGARGILVISCHLGGTPDSVFEGITASKGFVDDYNAELPVAGGDANRTLFHVRA